MESLQLKGKRTHADMAHSKTAKHAVLRLPADSQDATPPAHDRSAKDAQPAKEAVAGQIKHDERGNAVFNRRKGDSTSTMLKRLEVPGLKVEGLEEPKAARPVPITAKAKPASRAEPGGGYNPYDQGRDVKKPTTPKGPVRLKPERAG
jgi:hypothetical protein